MPSKAKSVGQGESAMAGSEDEVGTGGTEVSLPAIALWGEREQLMWGEGTALVWVLCVFSFCPFTSHKLHLPPLLDTVVVAAHCSGVGHFISTFSS